MSTGRDVKLNREKCQILRVVWWNLPVFSESGRSEKLGGHIVGYVTTYAPLLRVRVARVYKPFHSSRDECALVVSASGCVGYTWTVGRLEEIER